MRAPCSNMQRAHNQNSRPILHAVRPEQRRLLHLFRCERAHAAEAQVVSRGVGRVVVARSAPELAQSHTRQHKQEVGEWAVIGRRRRAVQVEWCVPVAIAVGLVALRSNHQTLVRSCYKFKEAQERQPGVP